MDTYAQALNIGIPFFIVLILLEAFIAKHKGIIVNHGADTISSISSGITNVVKDVLGLSIAIIGYGWLVEHLALFTITSTWIVYVIAFVVLDFAGYWMHRLEHEVNILWNRHIIHHSSEEFNLACALRQNISAVFSFIALFMIPAALVGVPGKVFALIAPIHLFAQFWYHTRLIDKMGWLEYILVTPSHHRVHHAINNEYLDKNYGQILIIWDKLFGSFQPELESVPPVYGVKRPVKTWNPILINFQHIWLIIRDAWHAKSWWDKIRIWFMPTGWRPEDVAKRYPIPIIDDVYQMEKYDNNPSLDLLIYGWSQLAFTLGLMFWLFNHLAEIGMPNILLYGLFIFITVSSYTALLDQNRWALWIELLRFILGFTLLIRQGGDWFGLKYIWPAGPYLIGTFFILSMGYVVYVRMVQSGTKKGSFTSAQ